MKPLTLTGEERALVGKYQSWMKGFEESSLYEDYQTYDLPEGQVHFTNDEWMSAQALLRKIAGH